MNDRNHTVRATARNLRELLFDWAGHVESWLDAPFPVLPVRYEDLLAEERPPLYARLHQEPCQLQAAACRIRRRR